jgi:hypothetical protein
MSARAMKERFRVASIRKVLLSIFIHIVKHLTLNCISVF